MENKLKEEDEKNEKEQIEIHSEYWKGVSGEVMLQNHRDECECSTCMDKGNPKECLCKKCEWFKTMPCEWRKGCVYAKEVGEITSASPTSNEGMELSQSAIKTADY